MMQRVRQFLRAIFASVSAEDERFLQEFLSEQEQSLFCRMLLADQYQALQTAYTAQALWAKDAGAADERLLTRCALLHDIGRKKGDMGIAGKVFAVLMHKFFFSFSMRLAERGASGRGGFLCHVLYIYYQHAELGAAELSDCGLFAEACIVREHHHAPKDTDPPELLLLRRADELN